MSRTKEPCKAALASVMILCCTTLRAQDSTWEEPHRPLFHFTPARNWMNDPNGLVSHKGVYHMFFQYHPDGMRWGPMHWGHAVSRDLRDWEDKPIALRPDSLGYIFSGSVVVDSMNTSGFGKGRTRPMVAVFTHHNPVREAAGRKGFQYQSLAYSLDDGETWTKYAGNPVLQDTASTDFRDPKVIWHKGTRRWVMALATKDRVTFFSSPDLKSWTRESSFGENSGAHGGVWECPDLFPLPYKGRRLWVLLVSLNPGAPNGGSGTQYFIGDFDGRRFTPYDEKSRWVDHGTDNYAGVTFSNTGDRRIFIGWMSNWDYAQDVPTETWRSAMTIPRDLSLEEGPDGPVLCSKPAWEFRRKVISSGILQRRHPKGGISMNRANLLKFHNVLMEDFSITLSNDSSDRLIIGYEASSRRFYIDRTASGNVSFSRSFPSRQYAPRVDTSMRGDIEILLDDASAEVFADEGSTVMTCVFFPKLPMDRITMEGTLRLSALCPVLVPPRKRR